MKKNFSIKMLFNKFCDRFENSILYEALKKVDSDSMDWGLSVKEYDTNMMKRI
jgi:hypothetical protein